MWRSAVFPRRCDKRCRFIVRPRPAAIGRRALRRLAGTSADVGLRRRFGARLELPIDGIFVGSDAVAGAASSTRRDRIARRKSLVERFIADVLIAWRFLARGGRRGVRRMGGPIVGFAHGGLRKGSSGEAEQSACRVGLEPPPGATGWVVARCRSLAPLLVTLALTLSLPSSATVHVLSLRGVIGPAVADSVVRGLEKAGPAGAALVVLEIDTPGGLDSSMRQIVKAILASSVPVASYVSPSGARAASAGTYILYASHIAAMARATNLGAATPVELLPTDEPAKRKENGADKPAPAASPNVKASKAINDASAYLRGLAELRGRNADWAERAVREGASLSADAALEARVIDLLAADLSDLLRQVHGRKLRLAAGEITLDTAGQSVTRVEPDWRSRLLGVIGDPSIAYILLLLGIYGLIYEFTNPGMLFPGVVGAICLLLALFALHVMPVSYAGVALIVLGMAMIAAEAFLPSFGALGLGGIAAFVLGSVMLIDTDVPGYGLPWELIASLAALSAVFSFAVATMALRARRRPVVTGSEALPGSEGEALEDIANEGWARVHGELWRIRTKAPVARTARLRVTGRNGLTLEVEPMSEPINPGKENGDV